MTTDTTRKSSRARPDPSKSHEQALQETAARLLAVVNTAVDGIITINELGEIASFNPAAERLFGYSAGEAVGKKINMLMPEPYSGDHDDYLRRYLKTGKARIIGIGREVVGRRKDGTIFPMDLSVGESRLGVHRFFTGIVRDITERRLAEQQILALQREVAARSERERHRIGRDLHDGLGQELTNVLFRTGVLQKVLTREGRPEAGTVGELVSLIQQAIDHLRELVRGLCPVIHDSGGLELALRELTASVDRLPGIDAEFECDGSISPGDAGTAMQLYYIASEAVNNAVKHARATRVTLRLGECDGNIELTVSDDGRGFNAEQGTDVGRGLRLMAYRAQILDGTFQIQSSAGRGTTLSCSVPVSRSRGLGERRD